MNSEQSNTVGSKVTMVEKLGYGLGDTAANLIFQTIVNFIALYYTDIVGLSPYLVATLFLAVRVMDAVTDPIMGAIADRSRTRLGRFRPWILWLAIPFGVSAVLTFSVPEFSESGKAVYAFITYAVMMLMYTAVNIPYAALASAMTTDSQERTSIQSWRFALSQVGNTIVSAGTLPLVAFFGQGDDRLGYQYTIGVFGVFGILFLVICFFTTRERVATPPSAESKSLVSDLKKLWQNDQWRILALANFILLIAVVLRGTVVVYFVEYDFQLPDLRTVYLTLGTVGAIVGSLVAGRMRGGISVRDLGSLVLIHSVLLGILFTVQLAIEAASGQPLAIPFVTSDLALVTYGSLAAVMIVCHLIGRLMNRAAAFSAVFLIYGLAHFGLFAVGDSSFAFSTGVFVAIQALNMVGVVLIWTLMTDSVDYGQWKTGVRTAGLNFSANLFALKMGVAVGGAAAGWILGHFGYVANAEQTPRALLGIGLSLAILPGVCGLVLSVLGRFLTLTTDRMAEIQKELAAQEENFA